MPYPGTFAARCPDKPAVVMATSGEVVTYRELYERAVRLSRVLHDAGLRRGDRYAVLAGNHVRYFEVVWAGLNSGLQVVTVNPTLSPGEVAYVVEDSGAKALIADRQTAALAGSLVEATPAVNLCINLDAPSAGQVDYDAVTRPQSTEPLQPEWRGGFMLYSSGTTGRPKGVEFAQPNHLAEEGDLQILASTVGMYDLREDDVYLSTAPLHHTAPLRTSQVVHCIGGTVVVMERFDAELALAAIERYGVTVSQWVPTMFVRMLRLDDTIRARYDVSSLRVALHAAAPCPVAVKEQMIEWWGPVFAEMYGGTEAFGGTFITSEEWLRHKGSVGRAYRCAVHVCDDEGTELAPGEVGTVYFERDGVQFRYHNDPDKSRAVEHPDHPTWRTLGDLGRLDEEGYLYLSDRKAFTIVSGGVNIYPAEVENVLVEHPGVADVAVFGVPNDEFGEEVKAVVQPVSWADAGPDLAAELIAHCRTRLAAFKCPRSVDFDAELPRLDNGKLFKTALRDRYWAGRETRIG